MKKKFDLKNVYLHVGEELTFFYPLQEHFVKAHFKTFSTKSIC